ncbi:hypothetical protein SDC9_141486 [bioreactor metagenome]|uniref:Uncharacterized protein n=1 Tax=bioreactor metagenome TaxID=1076179 RepID=A0A645DXU5_9ZZZZ
MHQVGAVADPRQGHSDRPVRHRCTSWGWLTGSGYRSGRRERSGGLRRARRPGGVRGRAGPGGARRPGGPGGVRGPGGPGGVRGPGGPGGVRGPGADPDRPAVAPGQVEGAHPQACPRGRIGRQTVRVDPQQDRCVSELRADLRPGPAGPEILAAEASRQGPRHPPIGILGVNGVAGHREQVGGQPGQHSAVGQVGAGRGAMGRPTATLRAPGTRRVLGADQDLGRVRATGVGERGASGDRGGERGVPGIRGVSEIRGVSGGRDRGVSGGRDRGLPGDRIVPGGRTRGGRHR